MNKPLTTPKNSASALPTLSSALLCLALTARAAGQPAASPDASQKPAWLSELSLGVKETYDDNVFMSGVAPSFFPAYSVPSGSVAAIENKPSWVSTVSPKVGVDLAPLLASQNTIKTLSLSYAPDFVIYHGESQQDYNAHRVLAALKAQPGNLSISLDNAFTYVDGSDHGALYPGGLLNAWSSVTLGQRVRQVQERSKAAIQYDWEKFFVRPTATLVFLDPTSQKLDVEGYQNYPERYDVNGGLDFGYKLATNFALTAGYRFGHQFQATLPWSTLNASSDYTRLLLGLEGKPWNWLTASLQAGPDFRDYNRNAPVNDFHPVKYYAEASLSARLSPDDTIAFKYKQYQWVSMCGKVPYFDSTFDLTYHRQLAAQWALDLQTRALKADYTSGNVAGSKRDDIEYTAAGGVTWSPTAHLSLNLAYTANLGRDLQDYVVSPQNREFDQELVSLGATLKF